MTSLELAAHCVVLYGFIINTYLFFKELRRREPMSFLEFFMYTEDKMDKVIEDMAETIKKKNISNFDHSLRITDRINRLIKIIEDDKNNNNRNR